MTFLNLLPAAITAGLVLPLLAVLYMLKLRRRRVRIGSSMLWPAERHDLQVDTPFRRLRITPLLLLQALILILLLLALADPVIERPGGPAVRTILLVDTSASMRAVDAPPDPDDPDAGSRRRLDQALDEARRIVRQATTGRRGDEAEIMVIAFARRPQVVLGFDARRTVLEDALDRIEATDEPADLEAALRLASGFSRGGASEDAASAREPAEIVLLSDGGVRPPVEGGFRAAAGTVRMIAVGPAPTADGAAPAVRNVAVADLSARRDLESPERVLVFARLLNAGPEPVSPRLALLVGGELEATRRVEIPAAGPDGPGEATEGFDLVLEDGAAILCRLEGGDPMPADDVAATIVPPPAAPRIALVHGGSAPSPLLAGLLAGAEPRSITPIAADAFARLAEDATALEARFDLVVADAVEDFRLPAVPSLVVGGSVEAVPQVPPAGEGGRRVLAWAREHPVMRYVGLDDATYTGFGAWTLPPGAEPLADGPDGPVIALARANGVEHVLVGFELGRTNWSTQVGVAVFAQNVLDRLLSETTGNGSIAFTPGVPIEVRARPEATAIRVEGPDGRVAEVPVDGAAARSGGRVRLPGPRLAGLYRAEGARPPRDLLAVNVADAGESDLRPRPDLRINAAVAAEAGGSGLVRVGLWPWLAACALALCLAEWAVHCRWSKG